MSQHNSDQQQQQQQIEAPSSPTNSSSQINSTATTSDGILLFACTKCNGRHRFEELSRRHQLCKSCKSSVRVLNCDYCSGDFKLDEINNSKICKKCQILQGQHGQPEICSCCGLKAAFIGSKCQRCNNSEKKYGLPLNCELCSKKCAFERPDPESRAKVGGKLLCWTCTMNFKRSQAKEKHKQGIDSHKVSRHSHHSLKKSEHDGKHTSSSAFKHDRHHHHQRTHRSSPVNGQAKESTFNNTHRNQSHHHQNHSSTHNRESINGSSSGTHSNNINSNNNNNANNMNKRPRLEQKTSHQNNGQMTSQSTTLASANLAIASSFTENRFSDPKSTDLTSAMGQLKDEISTLNKRLNLKERELLAKDQQIADLKSTLAREQKEMRDKVSSLQKQHTERITEMQSKLIQMQKQVVTLTKASRANNTTSSTYLEPPMVI